MLQPSRLLRLLVGARVAPVRVVSASCRRTTATDDPGPGRTAPHRGQPTITDDEGLASSQPAGCARAWTRMFTETSSREIQLSVAEELTPCP